MLKGDLAFAHIVKELSNNGLFLVEYNGKENKRVKVLGNSKVAYK